MLPDAFERTLQTYDPLLSLRYGDQTKCWIVERKARRVSAGERSLLHHGAHVPNPEPKAVEEWRSLQSNKRVLFYVNQLDNRVFDQIRLRDLQKRGFAPLDASLALREKRMKAARAEAHEKARLAADVVFHLARKRSDDLRPDVTRNRMAQALGQEMGFQDKRFSTSVRQVPPMLLDSYGRSLVPNTEVKLHLATQ